MKLDDLDVKILQFLQHDSKPSTSKIARVLHAPVTTVYAKIARLEKTGIISHYRAVLDAKKVGRPVVAFVLVTVSYGPHGYHLEKTVAKQITRFPEVQEVHVMSGEWDFIIKIRLKDVTSVGAFITEKLRSVKGVDKTITCMVFDTPKETTEIGGLSSDDMQT